jgi:hypothetical protein
MAQSLKCLITDLKYYADKQEILCLQYITPEKVTFIFLITHNCGACRYVYFFSHVR